MNLAAIRKLDSFSIDSPLPFLAIYALNLKDTTVGDIGRGGM